jgi:uncharacterized protein (TIGR02996 family)
VTDDQRALLAAIVADPSDDTARLAFADCIEEHGNSARAEFIRLQVQAERLHPNANARAAPEERAEAIFAEHWVEWWGEVCEAVGLPSPAPAAPQPTGLLGRLARWVRGSEPEKNPYKRVGLFVFPQLHQNSTASEFDQIISVHFQRGFPESALCRIAQPTFRNWHSVSPLAELGYAIFSTEGWDDGPYLRGVRSLRLAGGALAGALAALQSPHMTGLDELFLARFEEEFGGDFAQLVTLPRIRQLKRLGLVLANDDAVRVLANSPNLAGLDSLQVDVSRSPDRNRVAVQRLTMLAQSPYLTELRTLGIHGGVEPDGFDVIFRKPAWRKLRKLQIEDRFSTEGFRVLANGDDLPELEEFYAAGMELDPRQANLLERAPLWKRLRHFSLQRQFTGGLSLSVLVNAMNLERLETFAVEVPHGYQDTSDCRQVREKLGERLRLRVTYYHR